MLNPRADGRPLFAQYLATSALAATGMVAAITISSIAAERMLGSPTWTGLPMAASILGTAFGSQLLGRRLERTELRFALAGQYGIGLLGGGVALLGVVYGQLLLLALGLALLGLGHGATQYVRYLAADLFAPERKAQILSWVVWTAGLGSVLGPRLLAPAGHWATSRGLPEVAGPYFAVIAAFAAGAVFYLALVPRGLFANPVIAGPGATPEVAISPVVSPAVPPARSSAVNHDRRGGTWPLSARLALFAMVTGHVIMVFVMTMTPIHLTQHGHGLGEVGTVISAHMAGMFLCAPVVGWLCGRSGPGPVLVTGSLLMAVAALLAALTSNVDGTVLSAAVPMSLPLFLLGLGWNCGFVAGSTLLNESLAPERRLRGRGFADAAVWTAAATSSLSSSLLFATIGFARLSWVACALAVGLLAILCLKRNDLHAATPA